jgi:hypothetical protein
MTQPLKDIHLEGGQTGFDGLTAAGGDRRKPPGWRIVAGFILAPMAPALLFALATLFDGLPNGSYLKTAMQNLVVGGYPAAILFGLPLYFALRNWVEPRFMNLAMAGGAVAAAPWLLLVLIGPQPDWAQIGSHVTVLDGRRTLWGWIESGTLIGQVFLLGTIGGAAFWLIAVARARVNPS